MTGMALARATRQKLEIAALCMRSGVSVEEYVAKMPTADWGDNLMVILMAVTFQRPIIVVGLNMVRTYGPNGSETQGPSEADDVVWIAHRGELHYYGVWKTDRLGRVGDCPLCVVIEGVLHECAVHYKRAPLMPELLPFKLQRRCRLRGKAARLWIAQPDPPPAPLSSGKSAAVGSTTAKAKRVWSKFKKAVAGKKKASAPDAVELKRICGNCGIRGHQAVTCAEPCFACGGDHKYFECTHDQLHHEAKRMASRNRVQ